MNEIKPRIETVPEKKLIGMRIKMSFTNNKTSELWTNFLPNRRKIKNNLNSELISLQIYKSGFNFKADTLFEKWALIEVSDFKSTPKNMEAFTLEGGLYAVFNYKGNSTDTSIFQYIFTKWLPNSTYQLDKRPHFEVLGKKYKNNDPNSEEKIYIPIKKKRK